jgi:hypothetical protein
MATLTGPALALRAHHGEHGLPIVVGIKLRWGERDSLYL